MTYARPETVEVPVPGAFITALPRIPREVRGDTEYGVLRPLLAGAPRCAGRGSYTATVRVPVSLLASLEVLAETGARCWEDAAAVGAAVALGAMLRARRCAGGETAWSVIIAKPGFGPVRIGPVERRDAAEDMAGHLMAMRGVARPEGTLVRVEPCDSGLLHLPLLPAGADELAALIDVSRGGVGAAGFPDLWARLSAQYPGEASRLWGRASTAYSVLRVRGAVEGA